MAGDASREMYVMSPERLPRKPRRKQEDEVSLQKATREWLTETKTTSSRYTSGETNRRQTVEQPDADRPN